MTMRGTTTVSRESSCEFSCEFDVSSRSQLTGLDCCLSEQKRLEKNESRSGFWEILQHWLTQIGIDHDPRVWQTIDRSGNCWWHAYHPATGHSATRESEAEILAWLDAMHR